MPMDEKEYRQHMIGDKIPIAKKDLVKGRNYIGRCRNADVALWTGKEFIYIRNKFGMYFTEKINHFEDDDNFDIFYPLEEIIPDWIKGWMDIQKELKKKLDK
jgi:hypothetical protein